MEGYGKTGWKTEYERWRKKGVMSAELDACSGEELEECFYKELEFGTGGIRAPMGPGPNRLNQFTVRKATEGYARHLLASTGGRASVAIAYDNRRNSRRFADEAAAVLSSHGIKVYEFEGLRPTPELSFAVRWLGASGGVVVTASHNPPEYNGYKIYDGEGCQAVPRLTDEVTKYIHSVGDALSVPEPRRDDSLVEMVGAEVDEAYYQMLATVQERPRLPKEIRIVYTPLQGTGSVPVRTMLERLGYEVYVVESQSLPDPAFRGCSSPNPEDRRAFDRALPLAREVRADLILATDPDCDRFGMAARDREGGYEFLSGNQAGALLLHYILEARRQSGTLPRNGIVFDTIVTSDLGARIARGYGMEVESTLTGFKYIGDKIREYGGEKAFVFGYEESYGCMAGAFTRDKDGAQGCILAAETANYCKLQGRTLPEALEEIYAEYGRCRDVAESKDYPGRLGIEQMRAAVDGYRKNPPKELEGRKVVTVEDYQSGMWRDAATGEAGRLTLPRSNVVRLALEDGSWVAVRPSGNEPKLKLYKCLWEKA